MVYAKENCLETSKKIMLPAELGMYEVYVNGELAGKSDDCGVFDFPYSMRFDSESRLASMKFVYCDENRITQICRDLLLIFEIGYSNSYSFKDYMTAENPYEFLQINIDVICYNKMFKDGLVGFLYGY
jgi:hypothetical protein